MPKPQLKNALKSQQSRLKKKQQAILATKAAEQKGVKTKHKFKGKEKALIVPFTSTSKILLVGEGNFSYARALLRLAASTDGVRSLTIPPRNITATAYDSEDECYAKYPDAREIVAELKENGVEVVFSVDATKLEKASAFKGRVWDNVMWNFPHAGKGITDQDRNILSNQILLVGFLRSVARFLAQGPKPSYSTSKRKPPAEDEEDEKMDSAEEEDVPEMPAKSRGTVLVTLRDVPPYTDWNLPRLAKNPRSTLPNNVLQNPPYALVRSFVFDRGVWGKLGYGRRMTKGVRRDASKAGGEGTTGENGESRTWEFCLRVEEDEEG